jgi:mono/diheme cytochrome c family protein
VCAGALVLGLASSRLHSQGQTSTAGLANQDANAIVKQYCVSCHNQRLKTGNLALDDVDLTAAGAHADRLEKVVRKLRAGAMPPAGAPRPDAATSERFVALLETQLDTAARQRPNPGRTEPLHRLNRTEYANAVRDVLGLEGIDVSLLLPPDDSSYGFDNMPGVLGMSPTHVERYLSAARKISRLAIGDATLLATSDRYALSDALTQAYRLEELPFGSRGGVLIRRLFPLDGEYVVKFQTGRAGGVAAQEPQAVEVSVDGLRVGLIELPPPPSGAALRAAYMPPPSSYEQRVVIKAGTRAIGVTFVKASDGESESVLQPAERSSPDLLGGGDQTGPPLTNVSISGPFNATGAHDTASRRRIFTCHPTAISEEASCARKILSTIARRAYRRPPTDAEMATLLDRYREGRANASFDAGVQRAVEHVLAEPSFLFRIETDPVGARAGSAYRISDLELASRLSFFLWSSVPDDELLDLAIRQRLRTPGVLERQTLRLLRDPRCTLVSNFASQWLQLRALPAHDVDLQTFGDFDDNLRLAFQRETELFVGSIVEEDRSVLEFLTANYTFLNERLARHYGVPNIYGSRFRRVVLDDPRRHGLLGKGSTLMVTALPNRTSPVVRGKFILEALLGAPPPPPPPNVPALQEKTAEGKPRSLRDAMVQHRANPVCAACHKVMDPLGFALENFNAVGTWRTSDAGGRIDASGMLPDGTAFDGVVTLREALVARPEPFVRTLTEKLLTYGLGRGMEYYDQPHVRTIVRDAATHEYAFSSVILGIVRSVPFQMRRAGA